MKSLRVKTLSGLLTFLLVLFGFSPTVTGEARLSFGPSGATFLGEVNFSDQTLGLTRTLQGEYGLGLSLSEEALPAPENWELRPFVSGLFESGQDLRSTRIAAGLEASYLDYQIGGWALSADTGVWLSGSGYRLSGDGSFSVGKLGLNYELGLSNPGPESDFWFPSTKDSDFSHLYRLGRIGRKYPRDSYLNLSGGRQFTVGENRLSWTQGLSLDFLEETPSLAMATRVDYENSNLSFLFDELRFERLSLQLKDERLSIGYTSTGLRGGWRGVFLGYHGEVELGLEFLRKTGVPESKVNLFLRW